MVMEKTMAWFSGVSSFMPSHMAASTRVALLEAEAGEEPLFSCESAWEEREKIIHSSISRNIVNLYLIVVCFTMRTP
jgi:hypothetical protein